MLMRTRIARHIALGAISAAALPLAWADGFSDYKAGNYAAAIPQLIALARQQDDQAIAVLCEAELLGRGMQKNLSPRRQCVMASDHGNPLAMGIVGQAHLYKLQHFDQNIPRGLQLLEAAALRGDVRAQRVLGDVSLLGVGRPANVPMAITYYQSAIRQGDLKSRTALGTVLLYGKGVPTDETQGLALLNNAAQQGDSIASYRLYRYYSSRTDATSAQLQLAMSALAQAVAAGHPDAQAAWGQALLSGSGVRKDPVQGMRVLQQAADKGSPRARTHLARAYLQGEGLPRDPARAKALLQANFNAPDPLDSDWANAMYAANCMNGTFDDCPGMLSVQRQLAVAQRSATPAIATWASNAIKDGERKETQQTLQHRQLTGNLLLGAVLVGIVQGAPERDWGLEIMMGGD